jgi:photosystem II stability/assembly factor-like uncharacterized protein
MASAAFDRCTRRGALLALASVALPAAAGVPAVLSQPALVTPRALGAAMLAVTRAGNRLVAVGERGTVLLSDDHGAHWRQAPAPVQVALTCVRFVDERTGWAAGHLGVVLRSDDGGASWRKQLDGIAAAQLALQAARRTGDAKAIAQALRLVDEGADKPFFDLEFIDAKRGFAIGAYNLLFATEDGGQTWAAWSDRLPNAKTLHLYGLRAFGSNVVIAGEQGLLLRSTDGGASFSAPVSPYKGSFFGVLRTQGNALVAYGLRGAAWRSSDAGEHWDKLDTGVPMSVSAGTALGERGCLLVSQAGDVLVSRDGTSLKREPAREPVPAAGVALAADGSVVLASLRGMRRLPAPAAV